MIQYASLKGDVNMYQKKEEILNSIINEENDKELFKDCVEEIITKENLSDYVQKVTLFNSSNLSIYGKYDYNKKAIYINEEKFASEPFAYMYYKKMLNIFYHEMRHAKQYKMIEKYTNDYINKPKDYIYNTEELKELRQIKTYLSSNKLSNKNIKKYSKYHDLFSAEHDAILHGNLDMSEYMKDIDSEISPGSILAANKTTLKLLLKDYKYNSKGVLVSPVEQLSHNKIKNKLFRNKILKEQNLTNYEKLELGLPIDGNVFEKYSSLNIEKESPKDFKRFIKKI